MIETPHAPAIEQAVLGRMMKNGERAAAEIVSALRVEDFYEATHRALYERIVENYYADAPLDALTIGQAVVKKLAPMWGVDDNEAIARVHRMAERIPSGNIRDHAKLVRDEANKRRLLDLATAIEQSVAEGMDPEIAASHVSERAMRLATDSLVSHDIIDFGTLGRNFVKTMEETRKLVEQGVELGARFGWGFIDRYTRGLRPTELLFCGGEPGAGKSAVWWKAAMRFAERQALRPADQKKIGTLVLSLEMGEEPSNLRIAQSLTGISGTVLRDGKVTNHDMRRIINEWGRRRNIPLYFDFHSVLRESQLRALIVEAIRRFNVGLIVIDHFKHIHTDGRFRSAIDAEEQKAAFLKTAIAEDLNVAVVCLAHTTKGVTDSVDKRPQLTHLRGSYQLAAIADFVSFIYRPIMHATEDEVMAGTVGDQDAEMIWRKNRHGILGEAGFKMDGETMDIR